MTRLPFSGKVVTRPFVAPRDDFVETAQRVRVALLAKYPGRVAVSTGRRAHAHVVIVKHCTPELRPKLEWLANESAKPFWCDAVAVGSSLTLTVKDGRAHYEEAKRMQKYGEAAYIDGVLHTMPESNTPLPGIEPYDHEAA